MIQQLSDVLAVALRVGLVLVLVQVYRAPHDVVLRYFALAVFFLVAIGPVSSSLQDVPLQSLVSNLVNIVAVFFQVCFFRTALRNKDEPPPRLWKEAAVATVVAAVGVSAWLWAPPELRPTISQPKTGYLPQAFVFVVVIIAYYASVSARTVVWSARLARRLYKQHRPETRAFLVGVIVIGAASIMRFSLGPPIKIVGAFVAFFNHPASAAFQGSYVSVNVLAGVGFVLFYVGALIPVADGVVRAVPAVLEHRRGWRDFGSLWQALHEAFPKVLLRTHRGIHRRFYRRGMEIRDGLVLLADYYDPAVALLAERESATRGASDEDRAITVAVALIRSALEAHRAQRPVPEPYPIPTSGALDWATDTAWLLRVARAFSARPSPSSPPQAMTSSSPITTTG